MRRSSRLDWNTPVNRLARRLDERRRRGLETLDLTDSNPARCGLRPEGDLLTPLTHPDVLRHTPHPAGLDSTRAAVAALLCERGTPVDPAQLLLTASTSDAYGYLVKLLCDPGRQVLVPRPSYPLLDYLVRLEGVTPVPYPLLADDGWRIDLDALRAAITPDTRALLLVSPNNPTGSCLQSDQLAPLLELCERNGIIPISDEVFADSIPDHAPGRVRSLLEQSTVPCFVLGGISKTLGLPQMKLAWIAVGGPPIERRSAVEALELIADTYLSLSTPVQLALPSWAEAAREFRGRLLARLDAHRRLLAAAFPPELGVNCLPADAGWSSVLRLPRLCSEETWALELLDEAGVATHPGFLFDFPGEAYLVVSRLVPTDRLRLGAERIAEHVRGRLPA